MKNKKLQINFKKKNVLISGASRGIGKDISNLFENLGANVIKLDSSQYDFRQESELSKLKNFIAKYDKIDILVNNAGINYSELNLEFSLQKLNNLMNVNLKTPMFITLTDSYS